MFVNTVTFLCRPFRALFACPYSQGLRPGLICVALSGLGFQRRQFPGLTPWADLFRPYDCAIWHVQVKRNERTWNLGLATWKEPVGRLEGCEPQVPRAPDALGLHNPTEGLHDQQH